MKKATLTAMFESNKEKLEVDLKGLSLPTDSLKVQKIISDYLYEMLNANGEFRQNLTKSEDYIMQAALSLLNAQQTMVIEIAANARKQEKLSNPLQASSSFKKEQYPFAIAASAVGSGIGTFLGPWGAVFGAIAGTALVLYYSSNLIPNTLNVKSKESVELQKPEATPLNVEIFLSVVKSICESVDHLIDTFRGQINRVVYKYESQEKPVLEKEYRFLLEGIQSLVGYKRTHDEYDDKFLKKIQERIEDLGELLENYNLVLENYSEEKKGWFDLVPSNNIAEVKMVYPAITREGYPILKGKAFIPA